MMSTYNPSSIDIGLTVKSRENDQGDSTSPNRGLKLRHNWSCRRKRTPTSGDGKAGDQAAVQLRAWLKQWQRRAWQMPNCDRGLFLLRRRPSSLNLPFSRHRHTYYTGYALIVP
jgi:hypothetical protein